MCVILKHIPYYILKMKGVQNSRARRRVAVTVARTVRDRRARHLSNITETVSLVVYICERFSQLVCLTSTLSLSLSLSHSLSLSLSKCIV